MQQKSPRGVQQEDVSGAADELLNEGMRPTIERVRLKMGRGSPNTVGPMLETWFGSLGARLVGESAETSSHRLPQSVLKAASVLWQRAERAAMAQADEAITVAHASLADARKAHEADVAALVAREDQVARREVDLTEALEFAKVQLTEQGERMSALSATIVQREAELEETRRNGAALGQELAAERRLRQEDAATGAQERRRQDERSSANERRLMEEVDRARQEAKQTRNQLAAGDLRLDEVRTRLQDAQVAARDAAVRAELELVAARQALASSEARGSELLNLLSEERKVRAEMMLRLGKKAAQRKASEGQPPPRRRSPSR